MKKKILWITETAAMLALLVALLGVLYYSAYSIKRKNHLV